MKEENESLFWTVMVMMCVFWIGFSYILAGVTAFEDDVRAVMFIIVFPGVFFIFGILVAMAVMEKDGD